MRRKKLTALFGSHASRGGKERLGSCMAEALPTYLDGSEKRRNGFAIK